MLNRIDDLLRMTISFGASDLHLRAGSTPVIRINGELKPLAGVQKLNQEETLEMAFSMMSNRQKQHFKEVFEVDIGYGVTGLGRFARGPRKRCADPAVTADFPLRSMFALLT